MKAILAILLAFGLIGCSSGYTLGGTTFKGDVDMYGNNLSNLTTPVLDSDAATKAYADSVAIGGGLPTTGGTMTGQIDFGAVPGYNIGTPVNDSDISTKKYVDDLSTVYAPIEHVTTKWNKTDAITLPENKNLTLDKGHISEFASDFMFNIMSRGATPSDYTDDAEAIQDTYDAAHLEYLRLGVPQIVYWPPGEWNGNSSQGGSAGVIVRNRPGVITLGAGKSATVFRTKDNLRDNETGVYPLWNGDEYMKGMTISGITFEHGNNIVESGENNYSAVGAIWCSDVLVYDVGFNNVSGTWALYLGQYGAHSADLKNALVSDITIHQVSRAISGDTTYDHTSVRINMDNALFTNSLLYNDAISPTCTGFELHGNNSLARGISVINYTTGTHLGADQNAVCHIRGVSVVNCFFDCILGVGVWSFPAGAVLENINILGNVFDIAVHSDLSYGAAVQTHVVTGAVRSLVFKGNTVQQRHSTGPFNTHIGLYLVDVYNLSITGNTFDNLTNAVKIEGTEDIGYYSISDNDIPIWGYGNTGQHTAGIYVDVRPSVLSGKVVIQNNRIGGNNQGVYGILTYTPRLANLDIVDNIVMDASTLDVITFIPTGYFAGEKIYIRHSSHEFGPTGNYAINGSTWECLGNGSLMRKDGDWKVVKWTYA